MNQNDNNPNEGMASAIVSLILIFAIIAMAIYAGSKAVSHFSGIL